MTLECADFLRSKGVGVLLAGDEAALSAQMPAIPGGFVKDVDCVITLGGDGTLLGAARSAAVFGVPILGINLGHLGYLTDGIAEDAILSLESLLAGKYFTEKRTMITATIEGGGALPLCAASPALNEAFVSRAPGSLRPLITEVSINDSYMDTYQADGILVSTPTGSTAYNLSAGGPVIKPDIDVLIITPVCAHALHARSAVVASSDIVRMKVLSDSAALYMDANFVENVPFGGLVTIQKSEYQATILKTKDKGFYEILREKMI